MNKFVVAYPATTGLMHLIRLACGSIFWSLHHCIVTFHHKSVYLVYDTAIPYIPASLKQVKPQNAILLGQQNVCVVKHACVPMYVT